MILLLLEEGEEEEEQEQKHDALAVFADQVVVVVILCIYICACVRQVKAQRYMYGENVQNLSKTSSYLEASKKEQPPNAFFSKNEKKK